MDYENLLQEIGLTNWETKAYLSLLKLGQTTTGELIKDSGVPASKIYLTLDSLMSKGLVSYVIKGKTKNFIATDPDKILSLFKEKERKVEEAVKEFSQAHKPHSFIEVYEGLKSIRNFYIHTIEKATPDDIVWGFSQGKDYPEDVLDFWNWLGELTRQKGLNRKLLITKKNKKEFQRGLKREDLDKLRKETRTCDVSMPGDVGIYNEMVVFFIWTEPYRIMVVHDKDFTKQYQDFFKELWENSSAL